MTSLFEPITVGDLDCPNRIFMAPLTRGRADRAGVPSAIMATYYAQRAAATSRSNRIRLTIGPP